MATSNLKKIRRAWKRLTPQERNNAGGAAVLDSGKVMWYSCWSYWGSHGPHHKFIEKLKRVSIW